MDIVTLGAALDPKPFLQGEDQVLAALKRIENAIRSSGQNMERDSQRTARGFGTMATAARTAATGLRSAFQNMSNAIGMVSPQLGFLIQTFQGFAGMMGGMISSLRNIGQAAGAAGTGFRAMAAGIGASVAVVGTLTVAIGALLAVLLPIVVAVKAASAAFNLFKEGLAGAAEFETYTTRFAGMLGGMKEAEERMASLAQFADKTPFELDEIVRASITLESLTEGMWSNEKAMLMIGDAAAKSGLKIDDFADRIGRVFSGIKNGGEWLETIKTLAGAGGIGGDVAMQIKEAVEAGKTMREVWAIAEKSLLTYRGQMANLATDFVGRSSTMSDAWSKFTRTLGQAILPAAKDVVIAVTDALNVLASKAEQWLPTIQGFADKIVATLMTIGEEGGLESTIRAATAVFEKTMNEGIVNTMNRLNEWMAKTFGIDLKAYWMVLSTLPVWSVIENEIMPRLGKALVKGIVNAIKDGMAAMANAINEVVVKATGSVGRGIQGAVTSGVNWIAGKEETPAPLPTAAQPAAELPFSSDGASGTFDLDTGAMLLAPFEENTAATETLTKAITDAMYMSPAPPTQAGPDASLFATGMPEVEDFTKRMEANLAQLQENRAAAAASRTYTTPVDKSGDWDKPTGAFTSRAKDKAEKAAGKEDPMTAEGAKITAALRTPSEEMQDTIANLEKLRDAGKISAETFERGVAEAREQYEGAVNGMTKAATSAAKEQEGALAGLMRQWGDMAKNIDQSNAAIAQSVSTNLTGAIVSMIDGTKSAKQAFSEMAASIVNDILRIITQMMVQYAIQSALGMVTGNIGGTVAAGVRHEGGLVGAPGRTRRVDASLFRQATRYHGGGMVGLQPGEVPIIAEKGEAVMTEDQQAAIKARLRGEDRKKEAAPATQAVTILNVTDPRQIEEHLVRNPQLIMNVISRQAPKLKQILNAS